MDQSDYRILQLISDENYHSGQKLAEIFGTSRAAISKRVSKINQFLEEQLTNYHINTIVGKGYCLNQQFDYLCLETIRKQLLTPAELIFFPVLNSTNDYLINKHLLDNQFTVCFTEMQTAGRGRSTQAGKKIWYSPFGNNIYCSMGWNYYGNQNLLLGLSLVAGLSVAEVLTDHGATNVGLKWPNDVLLDNKKIAGILMEIIGEPNGSCKLVLGFGINIGDNYNNKLLTSLEQNINQPWVNLKNNLKTNLKNNLNITRNIIIINLLNKFISYYNFFIKDGLKDFLQKWQKYDVLHDRLVNIKLANENKLGKALGLDNQGALLVEINSKQQVFYSGEVSVCLGLDTTNL
ncbi:MAG: biotin--[acetyl-CoA-carboxylase] ligase [Gammaproteobacteria bacterium]|nr:biotin--[acetyl-CoA-carboxylase] ligase [Gammaproteobacteria bacterium]